MCPINSPAIQIPELVLKMEFILPTIFGFQSSITKPDAESKDASPCRGKEVPIESKSPLMYSDDWPNSSAWILAHC